MFSPVSSTYKLEINVEFKNKEISVEKITTLSMPQHAWSSWGPTFLVVLSIQMNANVSGTAGDFTQLSYLMASAM